MVELLGQKLDTFLKAAPFPITSAVHIVAHSPHIHYLLNIFTFKNLDCDLTQKQRPLYAGSILYIPLDLEPNHSCFKKNQKAQTLPRPALTSAGRVEPPERAKKRRGLEGGNPGRRTRRWARDWLAWGRVPGFPKGSIVFLGLKTGESPLLTHSSILSCFSLSPALTLTKKSTRVPAPSFYLTANTFSPLGLH